MEFVCEWVKCQLKIYFYLYQNKKIPKIKVSKSMLDIHKNNYKLEKKINKANDYNDSKNNFDEKISNKSGITNMNNLNSSNCNQKNTQEKIIETIIPKNSTNVETLNNTNNIKINNVTNIIYMNGLNNTKNNKNQKRNNSLNYKNNYINNSTIGKNTLLLTSLPYIIIGKDKDIKHFCNTGEIMQQININKHNKVNRIFKPIEAKKVNIKIKGINKERDKLIKEITTAEMLPLLKNKTYHQMRNFFDERIHFSRKIDKKIKQEINSYSLNGTNDELRLVSLIASGKIKALNYESLFKLKKTLGS